MKIALMPGSFDPITNGHKNIIEKGLKDYLIKSLLQLQKMIQKVIFIN